MGVSATVVVVLAGAAAVWSTSTFMLTLTVLTAASALLMAAIHDLPATPPVQWPRLLGRAVLAGAGLSSLVALIHLSVALAAGVLIAVTVLGPPLPWVVCACLQRQRLRVAADHGKSRSTPNRGRGPQVHDVSPTSGPSAWDWAARVDDAVLGGLTPTELCWAWQSSYASLIEAPDVGARVAIAGCRQRYLDEIERRDAAGLGNWLHAGARAASSPKRYLH